ncbi:protein of unknown function [Butyrivibrio proteoclasticus]|uniref:DUF4214 domain-containing protein n=1 Tax=Butyrivibrio proteoclasticus TaxID=43305 RepID=A0A1I5TZG7_9FIRM|nr:DUF4214 domain-containing protein [Butyrivibrio proteoclasticus]SFP88301.1 protein of unknown function [Butyrivibrio proteoclasticus]
MKKRFLSLLLSGIMFFTYPVVAFAEDTGDVATILLSEESFDDTEENLETDEVSASSEKTSDVGTSLSEATSSVYNDTAPVSDEATTLDGEKIYSDINSTTIPSSNEADTDSNKESTEKTGSLHGNFSASDSVSLNDNSSASDSVSLNDNSSASDSASLSGNSDASTSTSSSESSADSSFSIDESYIEAMEPETITVNIEENEVDNLPDEEKLFAKYVDKQFGVDYFEQDTALSTMLFRRASAYNSLTDNEKKLYDKAYDLISRVASGQTSDTKIELTTEELGISLDEIQVEDLFDYSYSNNIWTRNINTDKKNQGIESLKAQLEIDGTKIITAIISDHPESLYWFGRQYAIGSFAYSFGENNGEIKKTSETAGTKDGFIQVAKFIISFSVSQSYGLASDDSHYYTYKADTEKTSATSTALANAQDIADSFADLDDFEKIVAFKEKICSLVEYNYTASHNSVSTMGSNPWELIYVFDDDPETNVVCEGYSKAFQYLCDISSFNNYDLYVLSVTGEMNGGPHMWNIVHIDDKNYLTDVTNCDGDIMPQGNTGLFMKGYTSGDVNSGYIITRKTNSTKKEISYTYSNDMLNLYSYDLSELALNDNDYSSESMPVDPFSYTIKFDRNTGNYKNMNSMTCINGQDYKLNANVFTKDCNKFVGWNTKADGTGKSYSDGMTVRNLATEEGQIITLYAQWKADPDICDHKSFIDGHQITCSYVITKEATATEYGRMEKRCDYCGKVIESKDIHPYDTYRIEKSDGTFVEVKGYFDHDYAKKAWELTNKYRKEKGLDELTYNECTQADSDTRALEYAIYNSYYRPNGQKWNTLTAQWKDGVELGNVGKKTPDELIANWTSYSIYSTDLLGAFAASSVGCFHVVNFTAKDGITEKISWTQQLTLIDADSEQTAITKQPESVIEATSRNVTFQIIATGVRKYQWQYRAVGNNSWINCSESGNNTDKLSFYVTADTYNKEFRCVVTGTDGSNHISDVVNVKPKITYTISFDRNSGDRGYMSSLYSCVNEKDYVLPECTYTKANSIFLGWNTKADGSGVTYANKATVRNLATQNGQTITLYALWKTETQKTEPQKTEPQKTETQKTEPQKSEPQKTEPQKTPSTSSEINVINISPSDGAAIFVTSLYEVCLNRSPETEGLEYWTNSLTSGEKKAVDIVQGVLCSQEYSGKGKSTGEVVNDCYQSMLGRDADEGGYADWTSQLDAGMSVNAIFAGFVGSEEFANLCASYGIQPGTFVLTEERDKNAGVTKFVSRLYTQALGRNYDVDGLNDWCGRINANSSRSNILNVSTNGFFHSQEFTNKNLTNTEFVKVLYRTFLGREYDDAGLANWVGQLDRGENTRDGVISGFANSQEFSNIMAQYGL